MLDGLATMWEARLGDGRVKMHRTAGACGIEGNSYGVGALKAY